MKKAKCDYCGKFLGCRLGSIQDDEYWMLDIYCRACDMCILKCCDDYSKMKKSERVMALRLRHSNPAGGRGTIDLEMIDATIKQAQNIIVPALIEKARGERERVFALHKGGEFVAAIEAGHALWNTADGMNAALTHRPEVITGRKAKKQRQEAGFSSGKERQDECKPTWDEWQKRANELHSQNPRLTKTAISERIAGEFGVTRRTVSGRIQLR